ncbi:MAG: sugar transporter, partial [Burkholderiaceae bacterium]|nr:sugar transporter [Burkholderiaceae bacterium]
FGLLILQTISECIKRVLVLQGNASLNDSYQRPQQ